MLLSSLPRCTVRWTASFSELTSAHEASIHVSCVAHTSCTHARSVAPSYRGDFTGVSEAESIELPARADKKKRESTRPTEHVKAAALHVLCEQLEWEVGRLAEKPARRRHQRADHVDCLNDKIHGQLGGGRGGCEKCQAADLCNAGDGNVGRAHEDVEPARDRERIAKGVLLLRACARVASFVSASRACHIPPKLLFDSPFSPSAIAGSHTFLGPPRSLASVPASATTARGLAIH